MKVCLLFSLHKVFVKKNILAKYLANKYNGLYVDVDLKPDRSILSQIEAFIELRTSS